MRDGVPKKVTISLTALSSATVEFDRDDLLVVESIAGGSLVTLRDGSRHHVSESAEIVLELFRSRSQK